MEGRAGVDSGGRGRNLDFGLFNIERRDGHFVSVTTFQISHPRNLLANLTFDDLFGR